MGSSLIDFFVRMMLAVAATQSTVVSPPSDASPEIRSVEVQSIQDISAGFGPASGPSIAAADASQIVVGWCVEEGIHEGVYLRLRQNFVWNSLPVQIDAQGHEPRDLVVRQGPDQLIHATWTAAREESRHVVYAQLSPDGQLVRAPEVMNSDDQGDSDFPQIGFHPGFGTLIAWQWGRGTAYVIEGIRLRKGHAPERLASISGDSRAAIDPQIIENSTLTVSWFNIGAGDKTLEFAYFDHHRQRWASSPETSQVLGSSSHVQVLIPGRELPYAAHLEAAGGADQAIHLQRGFGAAAEEIVLDGSGDATAVPEINWVAPGELTLTWPNESATGQSVQVGAIEWPRLLGQLTVSPDAHHYSSHPTHVTVGGSSFVAWIDAWSDGGSGELGFSEINWDALR